MSAYWTAGISDPAQLEGPGLERAEETELHSALAQGLLSISHAAPAPPCMHKPSQSLAHLAHTFTPRVSQMSSGQISFPAASYLRTLQPRGHFAQS